MATVDTRRSRTATVPGPDPNGRPDLAGRADPMSGTDLLGRVDPMSGTDPNGKGGDIARADPPSRTADRRRRWITVAVVAAAVGVLVAALYPSLQAGFWSWDWYWIDQHAQGNTAWGGPFYDIAQHANPLPVEVQWYRATLVVFGLSPFAHHLLALAGFLATLGMLYLLAVRLYPPRSAGPGQGIARWAGIWAVVLAGLAPASLTSWTWFAASPHMWAALAGLGAAVVHLTWRQGGSRTPWPAIVAALLSAVGLAMKNDAVIGPLVILAWEWTGAWTARAEGRDGRADRVDRLGRLGRLGRADRVGRDRRPPGQILVSLAAVLPMALFVWWQGTAVDPHREQAQTGLGDVVGNAFGLLRFAFLWQSEAELRAEFPPAPSAPFLLLVAGAVVGAAVLLLALISLRTRAGIVLVAAGLASLGPVAVLQPALLSRYVLPPVLLITLAAGVGAGLVVRRFERSVQARGPQVRASPLIAGIAVSALLVWGILAHLSSSSGVVATREERALLAGLTTAGIAPGDRIAVRLAGSPVEPTTAAFRQYDPQLPRAQRLRGLRFLAAGEDPPHGMPVATATRRPDGTYTLSAPK